MEQLDLVQANRQQELMHTKIFKKLSTISSEYFEIAKLNDEAEQVFNFVGDSWNGVNRQVMLNSYIVIAKIVSVLFIAASLYVFNPWLCLIVLIAPLPTLWISTIGEKLRFKFVKRNTELTRRHRFVRRAVAEACHRAGGIPKSRLHRPRRADQQFRSVG